MTREEANVRLDECRMLIDDVDRRIVALLNERTQVVEEIGRVKRASDLPIYEPKREEQVFANVTRSNQGRPRRMSAPSIMSSCTSVAVCTISTTAPSRMAPFPS